MVTRLYLLALSIILLVFSAGVVLAKDEPAEEEQPWSRYKVSVGGFLNAVDSRVMLGAEGVGVSIDIEEVLGLDAGTTVFRLDGFWRYTQNRRHRLDLGWFAIHRGGEHIIDRNIDIGDTLYLKGTRLNASLDIDIFKGSYSYSFFQDDRIDMAVSAGFFVMPVGIELSATRETTRSGSSADITAPLPVLGFRTDTALTPKWYLRGGFEVFYIEIGDFKGAITDLIGSIEYNPYRNLGFGLGFETFRFSVQALMFYVRGKW